MRFRHGSARDCAGRPDLRAAVSPRDPRTVARPAARAGGLRHGERSQRQLSGELAARSFASPSRSTAAIRWAKAAAASLSVRSDRLAVEPLQHPRGNRIAFRMDPGGIQRIFAAGDLEEPGRLHERGIAEAGHLAKLLAAAEGTVLAAILIDPPGRELIEPGHVTQQRRAGRVHVDADVVHARLDDFVQRDFEVLGLDVVLIQPDADVGRLDLDQFAERIQQPPSDGNGAAERGIVFGKFLAAQLARRVDAGAGLVDDHVGHALVLEFRAEQLGEEVFGLAAGRAVADGHDGQLVLADQLDRLLLGLFLAAGLAADQVNHVVPEHVAELVQRGQLATALETGIDGQHAAVVDRRLQEQVAEIAGEDADGVRSRPDRSARGGPRAPGRAGSGGSGHRGRSRGGNRHADGRAARGFRPGPRTWLRDRNRSSRGGSWPVRPD